jgi:hypothetical protein
METPTWLNKAKIKTTFDARPVLAQGEHPLERVISETASLQKGEIYETMPMIEKLKALGFGCHSEMDNSGLFHTYFLKN